MEKKIISIVGGTGNLGSLIVQELLQKPDVQLRLLVRPESRDKVNDLEKDGVQIVEGTLGNQQKDAVAKLCKGATTVISTVMGGADVFIEGQKELLQAAKKAGVKRFIPSTFTVNMFEVKPAQMDAVAARRKFASYADKESGDVEVVHVLVGAFLDRKVMFEFMNVINTEEQKAYVWGDEEKEQQQPIDCTTYADTAKYTAEAAIDDDSVPEVFSIAGDTLSFLEMVQVYEEETGQDLEVVSLGSMDDMDDRIEELKQGGRQNVYAYLSLMYYHTLLDGSGKLNNLMNDRYPSIKTTTFREYVNQEMM